MRKSPAPPSPSFISCLFASPPVKKLERCSALANLSKKNGFNYFSHFNFITMVLYLFSIAKKHQLLLPPQKKIIPIYATLTAFESHNLLVELNWNSRLSSSFSGLMVEVTAADPKVDGSSHTLVGLIILVDSGVSKTLWGIVFVNIHLSACN